MAERPLRTQCSRCGSTARAVTLDEQRVRVECLNAQCGHQQVQDAQGRAVLLGSQPNVRTKPLLRG